MNCPACGNRFSFGTRFRAIFRPLHPRSCGRCGAVSYGEPSETAQHLKLLGYVLLWFGLFLFCIAAVFGRSVGYDLTFLLSFALWLLVAGVFATLLALNVVEALVRKALGRRRRRK